MQLIKIFAILLVVAVAVIEAKVHFNILTNCITLPLSISLILSIIFLFLKAVDYDYEGEEEKKCRKQEGISKQVIDNLDYSGELPEKLHCFFKCVFEEIGYLSTNGTVMEKVIKQDITFDNEKEKVQLFECLETVGLVESCSDVVKLYDCVIEFED